MRRIVHLSDIHIAETKSSRAILALLPRALAQVGAGVAAVFITGDLFDTSDYDVSIAMDRFLTLHSEILAVLGDVPFVILPGNHDRRREGLFGPHDERLFMALSAAAKDGKHRIYVAGCTGPMRAELLLPAAHGLEAIVAAYDSTVLHTGLISAGGEVRQDDFIHLAALVDARDASPESPSPLFVLLHHHLIPTPITDTERASTRGGGVLERFFLFDVAPRLFANADREEIMMTALGAGTALSTLHAFGRPVIVLHGHKHYPSARLLVGAEADENDVVLLSAGSAGTSEAWAQAGAPDAGHLWPSFNVLDLEDDGSFVATTIAFSPVKPGVLAPPRPLADVTRSALRWTRNPMPSAPVAPAHFQENKAAFRLSVSPSWGEKRWDLACTRILRSVDDEPREYLEPVEGPKDAARVLGEGESDESPETTLPFHVRVSTAQATEYAVEGGVCRTVSGGEQAYKKGTAYEWVGMVNRRPAETALLELSGLPAETVAFGSATDMTTGRERPIKVTRALDSTLTLTCQPCGARTLLRIYWCLEPD